MDATFLSSRYNFGGTLEAWPLADGEFDNVHTPD